MSQHVWHERVVNWGLVALLVGVGVLSFDRASRGRFDFHHFYADARYVWEHGALNPDVPRYTRAEEDRQLLFYLPVVPLGLAPLTAFGQTPAALLWSAAQVAALGYSLRVLRRWTAPAGEPAPWSFALAVALALPALINTAQFNQLSYFVLALVLAGTCALDKDRPWAAGAAFAAAAVLKLLPVVVLPWLMLKRRWSAVAAFVATGVLVALLPPLVAFGPQRALEYHRQWWQINVRGDSAGGLLNMELPEHFIDHRNQSISQVLARWTWPQHRFAAAWQPVQLSPRNSERLAWGIAVLLAGGLLWATRRPWQQLSDARRHAELAAYALGMLVFSPLLRQYYLVWALPALVLLAKTARTTAPAPAGAAPRLARAGLGVWVVGMLAWAWPPPRLLGAHLLMLVAMGFFLLWATRVPAGGRGATTETRS